MNAALRQSAVPKGLNVNSAGRNPAWPRSFVASPGGVESSDLGAARGSTPPGLMTCLRTHPRVAPGAIHVEPLRGCLFADHC